MINTTNCMLSRIESTDYEEVKRLYMNPEVRRYLGGPRSEESLRTEMETLAQMKKEEIWFWVIRAQGSREFVGTVSLTPHHDGENIEVSYQLLPEWWGRGYAAEAVSVILHIAFEELRLPRIVAETQSANISSCKLLERLGMKKVDSFERFGEEQSLYVLESQNPSL